MKKQSTCSFKITGWDEKPYREFENGAKLTRAKVSQAYQGAIIGDASIEFLMSYAADGSVSFVGLELVTGTLDGKSGTFVIQHVGTYDSGGARSNWSIVPRSGTGELTGMTGNGGYLATNESVPVSFSYELPA